MYINNELISPFISNEVKRKSIAEQLCRLDQFYKYLKKKVLFFDLETGLIETGDESVKKLSVSDFFGKRAQYSSLKEAVIIIKQSDCYINVDTLSSLRLLINNEHFERIHFMSPYLIEYEEQISKLAFRYEEQMIAHNQSIVEKIFNGYERKYASVDSIQLELGNTLNPAGNTLTLNCAYFFKNLVKGKTFLEIGSGAGFVPIYLSQFSKRSAGIEVNKNLYELNKSNAQRNRAENTIFYYGFTWCPQMSEQFWDVIFYELPSIGAINFDPFLHETYTSVFADYKLQTLFSILEEADKYLSPRGCIVFGATVALDILNGHVIKKIVSSFGFFIKKIPLYKNLHTYQTMSFLKNEDIVYILSRDSSALSD
jgi:SAM-dependent methyltransferase